MQESQGIPAPPRASKEQQSDLSPAHLRFVANRFVSHSASEGAKPILHRTASKERPILERFGDLRNRKAFSQKCKRW